MSFCSWHAAAPCHWRRCFASYATTTRPHHLPVGSRITSTRRSEMFGMKKGSAGRHTQDHDVQSVDRGVAPQITDDTAFDGPGMARRLGMNFGAPSEWWPGSRAGDGVIGISSSELQDMIDARNG